MCIIFIGSVLRDNAARHQSPFQVGVMLDFLQTPTGKVVISLSLLAILVVVGVYVILKVRGQMRDDHQSANNLMNNFREMYEQGDISDAEFRKLKTVIGDELEHELEEKTKEAKEKPEELRRISSLD